MQNSATMAARDTVKRLPEMGPNKIQQALDDYDHMETDLAATKKSLAEYTDIANRLAAENDALKAQCKLQTDFLQDQVDTITLHRDRLQTALRGIMTRYKVIRECFAKCEEEALAEGLSVDTAGTVRSVPVIREAGTRLPAASLTS